MTKIRIVTFFPHIFYHTPLYILKGFVNQKFCKVTVFLYQGVELRKSESVIKSNFSKFCFRQFPLFLRLKLPTIITGIRPVDFPFKIFISGNLAGFSFFFSKCPFFQKIIKNPIIKPHTDRRMSISGFRKKFEYV